MVPWNHAIPVRPGTIRHPKPPRAPSRLPSRAQDGQIWEIRTQLAHRIARMLFAHARGEMILLHSFIKKDRKTPKTDLGLARNRLKKLRSAQ